MSLEKLLSQIKIFSNLGSETISNIIKNCPLFEFKRNECLFNATEPALHAFLLLTGSAKLFRSHPDGKSRIVHILLPGEIAGAPVTLNQSHYPLTAQTFEQSMALKIPANFLNQLLQTPIVGETLMTQMSERLIQSHQDQTSIYNNTEMRIAQFLSELLERSQTYWGKTTRIPIPLTRQDIADRIGASVETVIRIISQWQKQKLVLTQDKYFEIPNLDLLKKSAQI